MELSKEINKGKENLYSMNQITWLWKEWRKGNMKIFGSHNSKGPDSIGQSKI